MEKACHIIGLTKRRAMPACQSEAKALLLSAECSWSIYRVLAFLWACIDLSQIRLLRRSQLFSVQKHKQEEMRNSYSVLDLLRCSMFAYVHAFTTLSKVRWLDKKEEWGMIIWKKVGWERTKLTNFSLYSITFSLVWINTTNKTIIAVM